MRALIDASTANMGGARTHLRHLVRYLPEAVESHDTIILLVPKGLTKDLQAWLAPHNEQSFRFQEQIQIHELSSGSLFQQLDNRVRVIPQLARTYQADVLFSTTGYGSWNRSCPEVLHLPNAGYFCPIYERRARKIRSNNAKLYFRRALSLLSIKNTDFLLFLSESLERDVERYLSLEDKRSAVLHYGVDQELFGGKVPLTPPAMAGEIQRWKGEGYRILLHVSTYALQKNVETFLESIPRLLQKGHKLKWVTTLSRDKTSEKAAFDQFMQRVQELGLSDVYVSTGYLQHSELAWLYQNSDAFVFPSHTESFGQPLVEAMAAGLPVVASDRPVHHELGGEIFTYFKTFDAHDCARAVGEVLDTQSPSREWLERSQQRAALFSWPSYVRRVVELLRDVAQHSVSSQGVM